MTSSPLQDDPASPGPRKKNIVAIAGSLRRDSSNRRLLEATAECSPSGMSVRLYRDLTLIPMFNEDLENLRADGPPEAVRALREMVGRADGLLIATPEYNHSIPAVLKNAVDWLSREPDPVLAGKPIAIIGASSGRWGTRLAQAALRQTLYATESLVLPAPNLFIGEAPSLFDHSGRLHDQPTIELLQSMLAAFARWIDRHAQ